jgi:RsiW-degrading membrane proteinase PrsW (M82 family)
MRCTHCGNDVPEGAYCTRCGGALQGYSSELGDPKTRLAHFAAHPGEHVFHPGFISTLLPHLGLHKVHEFRLALIAGIIGVYVLYLAGLIVAALLVAAFLVPILYLLYLYEAQVYRDEPLTVLGSTVGGGIVIGVVVTLLINYFTPLRLLRPDVLITGASADTSTVFWFLIVVPAVQAILMPIPALVLRGKAGFSETVDGLVFGVAAGLGFSIAETIIRYWETIRTLPLQTDPDNWLYPLLTLAVLRPLLHASVAGAIAAAAWRLGRRKLTGHEVGIIVAAILAEVGFFWGSQLLVDRAFTSLAVLTWQVLVVGTLIVYIRYLLHTSLLEEAAHMGYSEVQCPNCHQRVMASGFCPHCGKALTAAPGRITSARAEMAAAKPATTEGT